MLPRVPIIVVLGATGTGKSKLAIEIAMKYGGEILSADSMQVYKGLDIITNKVTVAERQLAKHHMIDYVDPLKRFTVVDYRNQSLTIIDRLVNEKTLPVIVGGTNYYIESLLWRVLVEKGTADQELLMYDRDLLDNVNGEGGEGLEGGAVSACLDRRVLEDGKRGVGKGEQISGHCKSDDVLKEFSGHGGGVGAREDVVGVSDKSVSVNEEVVSDPPRKRVKLEELDSLTTAELHRKLMEVDPEMASRLHPNNRRKVMRSLQVFRQHGKTHSAILQEQRETDGGSELGGALRYPDSCILWIQCEQEVLNKRLDARVDDMLKAGLVQELSEFHERYNQERLRTNTVPDYTTGIFQSIGFKEFHEYLVLPPEEREQERGKEMLERGIEALKLVTRRYAKKQIKWIVNRFLRRPDRQVPKVFALDATDPSQWEEKVNVPSMKIVDSYINQTALVDVTPLPVEEALNNKWGSNTCDICSRVFVGSLQWNVHLKSKKHQKMVNRRKRLNPTSTEEDSKTNEPVLT